MKPRILLVDNTLEFLDVQARLLKQEGYDVSTASSVKDAELLLENEWFNLAILDQRMEDDNNEHDISGVVLARQEKYRLIPKIILTAYPDYESAVSSLGNTKGYVSAVDYIAKQKGPQVVSDAVKRILSRPERINWELSIHWKGCDLYRIVSLVEPSLERAHLSSRVDELEFIFHSIFHAYEYIRVDKLVWQKDERVALSVMTFRENSGPEAFLVICGKNADVNLEVRRFSEFAPQGGVGTGTMYNQWMETTHFGGIAYTIAGHDLERTKNFLEVYHLASEKQIKLVNDSLIKLFNETLQTWHEDRSVLKPDSSAERLYRTRLGLEPDSLSRREYEKRVYAITSKTAMLDLRIAFSGTGLNFQFRNQDLSLSDPWPVISSCSDDLDESLVIKVPGTINGENILIDELGRGWLTDFMEAGLAPLHWNHVALESVIRYDLVNSDSLVRRHELEMCLLTSDFFRPDVRDLEAVVRKPARAIQTIRKLIPMADETHLMDYQYGILLQALRRLVDFDPAMPITPTELARMGHILLSLALIAKKITNHGDRPLAPQQRNRIVIVDEKARMVLVGNRRERLAPQPFAVLRYLYAKANQVCAKEELLKDVLEDKYEENYLHTLIGRIRKTIEDDAETPRYLITVPGAGYRLNIKPK